MKDSAITVLIETRNYPEDIEECIKSSKFLTQNIIIVNLAKDFPNDSYVEPTREFGIRKVKTSWVFVLDPDERMTPELADEVRKAIKSNKCSHYKIPRKNIFAARWLRHGGWWPDYQIRLINKNYFVTWPKEIHSTPKIEGEIGYLKNPFIHFFHGDIASMIDKTIIFEDIESDLLFKADKKSSTSVFFRKFAGELYRRLIKKLGFLDGKIGIIEAVYQAFSKTITYLFLYEKKKSRSL